MGYWLHVLLLAPRALRPPHDADADTFPFFIDNDGGFVHFCTEVKCLGFIVTSDADVDKSIKSASAAFGALLGCVFANRDLRLQVKGASRSRAGST